MPSRKKIPDFATDEEAEEFVATADLSQYDLSDFVVAPIKFARASPNTFVPDELLDRVRKRAEQEGLSPRRFIERVLEDAVADPRR